MSAAPARGRSVALIGLRCSGKSSVGRRLARLLGLPFADLDLEIARLRAEELRARGDAAGAARAATGAGAVLAELGEEAFRALEERALRRLLAGGRPSVLATGGGAVLSPANRALLSNACRCVWLHAEPEVLHRRMAADPVARPALTPAGARAEIEELLRMRRPLYAELAELALDSGSEGPAELARRIATHLAGKS